jgi:putative heme iron utilization protein
MTRHDVPSSSGTQRQELLYDPTVPTPSHAEHARTLASRVAVGSLCTLTAAEPTGYPYGSFVTFALHDGSPVFLISKLAEHTRNLVHDSRASLLIVEPGEGDPLARGRVTLLGPCARLEAEEEKAQARAAFLAAHKDAAYYFDFSDFGLFSLKVTAVRYIGGYGRMSWVGKDDWYQAAPDPLAPHAGPILAHMNADHADTMVLYCRTFSKASDTSAAVMTHVDRYGFEMSATTAAGPRPIRLGFSRAVSTPDEVRKELVALARRARGETPRVP